VAVEIVQSIAIAGSVLAVGGLAVGSLYVLAVRVRDECDLHDVVVRAQELRLKQVRRQLLLDEDSDVIMGGASRDVEIVEHPPARDAA